MRTSNAAIYPDGIPSPRDRAPRAAVANPFPAPVTTAGPADAERCISVIASAFAADPAARWMYPDPLQYRECFPRFVAAFAGNAFSHGSAHVSGRFAATALWLGPGDSPDEESLMELVEDSVTWERRGPVFELFEQMGAWHPVESHWYLPLIGTDPARRGLGHGSALLRHALSECDRTGLPAYLEATSARNAALYRRHGFEALGVIAVAGAPLIHPMLRKPHPRGIEAS